MSIANAENSAVQIRLVAALDEPEFYCLDQSGWGEKLKPDDPIQVHTCKTHDGSDQMFTPAEESVGIAGSDRCLEVAATRKILPGSAVISRTCNLGPMQVFRFRADGQIEAGDSGLCLSAGAESTEAFGPSHVWRVLSMQDCHAANPELRTWQIGL